MDVLLLIKRLALRGDILFTAKSRQELDADALTESEVIEALVTARGIDKVLASTSPWRTGREKLYVIKGRTFTGIVVYTKGVIRRHGGADTFYVLISSKRAL